MFFIFSAILIFALSQNLIYATSSDSLQSNNFSTYYSDSLLSSLLKVNVSKSYLLLENDSSEIFVLEFKNDVLENGDIDSKAYLELLLDHLDVYVKSDEVLLTGLSKKDVLAIAEACLIIIAAVISCMSG